MNLLGIIIAVAVLILLAGVLLHLLPIAIGLALTIFWIVMLVDAARREFRDGTTKIIWLLVILLTHALGAVIYYVIGRPQGRLPGESYPPRSF